MGYLIGQVEEIVPDTEREPGRVLFKVRMSISSQLAAWKVPKDSYAKITAAGLLAATTIDIRAGESPEVLLPGDVIAGRGQTDIFATVSRLGEEVQPILENVSAFTAALREKGPPILTNVDAFTAKLKDTGVVENINDAFEQIQAFLTTENADGVKRTIDNVEVASRNLLMFTERALGAKVTGRVDVITENVEVASENLRNLLTPETGAQLRRALDNISEAAGNVAILSRDLRATRQHVDDLLIALKEVVAENRPDVRESVRHLRYTLSTVAQHIDALAQNLEGTSRNMYEFSRQVRQNPGVLLRGATPTDDAVPTAGRRPQ